MPPDEPSHDASVFAAATKLKPRRDTVHAACAALAFCIKISEDEMQISHGHVPSGVSVVLAAATVGAGAGAGGGSDRGCTWPATLYLHSTQSSAGGASATTTGVGAAGAITGADGLWMCPGTLYWHMTHGGSTTVGAGVSCLSSSSSGSTARPALLLIRRRP